MNVKMRKFGQKKTHDLSDIAAHFDERTGYLSLIELPKALACANPSALWEVDGVRYLSNTIQTGPQVRVRLVRPE